MIFRIMGFDLEIELDTYKAPVLFIKNKKVLKTTIQSINELINGLSHNDVVIDHDLKMISFNKDVIMILNYFNLETYYKQIETVAYKKINEFVQDDIQEKIQIEEKVFKLGELLYNLSLDLDTEFTYNNDINIVNLLKLYSFKVDDSMLNSSYDKLLYLISAISEFDLKKVIVFVNLKSFYEEHEILEIYKLLRYKKILFICIESNNYDIIGEEISYEIDEDFVEFTYSK